MKKLTIYILFVFAVTLASPPGFASAEDSTSEETIKMLALEDAHDLALKDHANIRMVSDRIQSLSYQLKAVQLQRSSLSQNVPEYPVGHLPTTVSYFLQQFPSYDQLDPDSQGEIDRIISTQILINQTFNLWIDEQSAQQQAAWNQDIELQTEAFNERIEVIELNQNSASFELVKTRQTVKHTITQQFFQLLIAEDKLLNLQKEIAYSEQAWADAMLLYEHGLLTEKDLEETRLQLNHQKGQLEQMKHEVLFQTKEFKLALGLSSSQQIQLIPPMIPMSEINFEDLQDHLDLNLDLILLGIDVQHAKEQFEAVESGNEKEFLRYHWKSKEEEQKVLRQALEKKLRHAMLEHEQYMAEITQLETDLMHLQQQMKDDQVQYTYGLISIKELEKNQMALQRERQKLQHLKWEYGIFREKLELIYAGVML